MKVFLTGATGFLGEYLLAELISRGHTIWGLYRDEHKRLKTELLLQSLGYRLPTDRLHWLQGDILDVCDRWDGWGKAHQELVEADTILHNAASLRFAMNDSGEPTRTNVGGAKALRKLVDRQPMQVHLLSTVAACGYCPGKVVYEVSHPRGEFVNVYEESKWEAEQIWAGHATILRPGGIVGDSETGRCTAFMGWYLVVRAGWLLSKLLATVPNSNRLDLQIEVPADPAGTSAIIPVDYVAKAAIRIIENPTNHNKIFHLTHPSPPTHGWSHEILCRRFRLGGIRFVGPNASVAEPQNEIQRMVQKQAGAMLPYFSNNPTFDRTNTDKALPDLEVPPITEDFVNRLVDYAIAANWGRGDP